MYRAEKRKGGWPALNSERTVQEMLYVEIGGAAPVFSTLGTRWR
jgi:hypothetical protein